MRPYLVMTLIVIVLLAVVGGIYYGMDGVNRLTEQQINLSISAEENNQKIKTGYILETVDGKIEGNTSQVYELLTVRKDQIIKAYNVNLPGQNYFKNTQEINTSKDNIRVDLLLEKPQSIEYEILSDNPLRINLKSKDARNITYCLDWSISYIFVESFNATEKDVPVNYREYNDCYDLETNLKNTNKTIVIEYKEFSNIRDSDYIKLLLIQDEFIGKMDQIVKVK